MFFVDWHVLCGAIDLTGGGVDDALDAVFLRGLADVERAFDVGIYIAVGRDIRIRNGDQRCKVINNIDAFSDVFAVMRVADIAVKNFNFISARDVFQPTPIVE